MSTQSRGKRTHWQAAALALGGVALIAACSTSTPTSAPAHTHHPTSTPTTASPTTTPTTPTTSPASPTTSPATSPTSTATVSAAACKHVDSLRGSLQSLTHVSLNASSAATISADLRNIEAQLTALKGDPQFSHVATELKSSIDSVKKAAAGMSSTPSASQIQSIIRSLGHLKGRAASFEAQMKAACPKS
jgi:hypothetical protein